MLVVHVPVGDMDTGLRVRHASFGDYIVARASDQVRIDASLGELVLARGCLHVMSKRLHFNVSQSPSSHKPNPSAKPDNITLSLEYACLHWADHLAALSGPSNIDEEVYAIFKTQFLFWLEAVSSLGQIPRAISMLFTAASSVSQTFV